jgi:FkbM family methyltransferase
MPRLIHRLARSAVRAFPPVANVPKFLSGIRRRLPPTDEQITVDLPTGGKMVINPSDYVSYYIYMLGLFEGDILRAALSLLHEADTFFDIGGHFGQYTIAAGRKVGETGKVYTFEPGPIQDSYLRKNIRLNNLNNVTVANVALSDQPGELALHVPSFSDIGKSQLVDPETDASAVRVPVTTLDQFCEDNRVTRIDVMKVDVEGAEFGVFKGSKRVMSDFPPKAIFYESVDSLCEAFGHTSEEMHDYIESAGYRIHTVKEGEFVAVSAAERSSLTDFVALR